MSNCIHNRQKSRCKECGGASICIHNRQKSECKECGGSSICIHNRIKSRCKECGGASICIHNRIKSTCKECGGSSICIHNRRKSECKECGGSSICIHNIIRSVCFFCNPTSKRLCLCGTQLSGQHKQTKVCAACEGRNACNQRIELIWDEKLRNWGYHATIHDKIIKDKACKVVSRVRVDWLFIIPGINYILVLECDENSHVGETIECEMARLQMIHDQLIANNGDIRSIVVLRFNPYDKDPELELKVKNAIDFALSGNVELNDDRGVVLMPLIGYSKKRKEQYDQNPLTKQIKL